MSSPQLSTIPATTGGRGSWPLIKYAGRGTPIDRNRRLEWGGFSGEEVTEDGLLFSSVRSTSLDSAIRPSERSVSPEWNFLSPLASARSRSVHSESTSRQSSSIHEQPPELAPIAIEGLGTDKSDEWDSIIKTVLATATTTEPPSTPGLIEKVGSRATAAELRVDFKRKSIPAVEFPMMSVAQLEQLNTGLEMDLNINAALDLGLGQRGGMNWFDLGLLPASANGHETPSVYSSQGPTPRPSPPPSVHASEHRSITSTKAESNSGAHSKSPTHPWWRKILLRLRKVQTMITVHKNRF
ncbi:hypothetical protein B0H34DRAFT_735004 [Crassisporium funariophilum]|nr:hypothetical protein B0H34DRAFT_735004 [Crassisporium funariophilum]